MIIIQEDLFNPRRKAVEVLKPFTRSFICASLFASTLVQQIYSPESDASSTFVLALVMFEMVLIKCCPETESLQLLFRLKQFLKKKICPFYSRTTKIKMKLENRLKLKKKRKEIEPSLIRPGDVTDAI